MTIKELIKNDSTIQGITVHHKTSNGYEWWKEYDSEGNEIHFKNFNGFECWNEYDSSGNLIHYRNSNGFESRREYDSSGNLIYCKNSDGYESWYDSEGNEIENPNKIKELTLEEIAEKLKIPVENLRIKD